MPNKPTTTKRGSGRPVTNHHHQHNSSDRGRDRRGDLPSGGLDNQAVRGSGPAALGPAVSVFHGSTFPSRPRARETSCVIVSS